MNEFTSTYYNDKNDSFEMLFQQYTASTISKIYCSSLIEEWKSNTEKAVHEQKIHQGVFLTYERREYDIITIEDY